MIKQKNLRLVKTMNNMNEDFLKEEEKRSEAEYVNRKTAECLDKIYMNITYKITKDRKISEIIKNVRENKHKIVDRLANDLNLREEEAAFYFDQQMETFKDVIL
jgi:hypothetical protein